jgi:hypothetical protein
MQKYRTWEVLEALSKNPELKFVRKAVRCNENDVEILVDNGAVKTEFGHNPLLICNLLKWEWELIQQPVPFMEAVKAYSEGKTIRCECNCFTAPVVCIYTIRGGNGAMFEDENNHVLTTGEILHGKWYIEEA